jgi:hypothetical protein
MYALIVIAVSLGQPIPSLTKPLAVNVALPRPASALQVESVQTVKLPQPGPTHQMWTPKPQVVFLDVPMEKRALYERVGPKLYRRIR